MNPDLSTNLCGLKLKNPTVLASGIIDNTGPILKRVADSGAGAVTTKSISVEPREGHKTPIVVQVEQGWLNAVGLPNPGMKEFLPELETAKKGEAPVIVSIIGHSVDEFVELAEGFSETADMLELNLSCPNVEGGQYFCQNADATKEVVSAVKKVAKVPISAKLGPNVNSIVKIAKSAESVGADAITAINTMPAMVIDVETAMPVLTNKSGGLSGQALRPIAVKAVYDIYEAVRIPIIGTGGVSNGNDAIEMMMAGATAVGIGTAVIERGPEFLGQISKEIGEFLERKGYKSVKKLIGAGHK